MQRVDAPEILDSDDCSAADVATALRDLGRMNRWFGGMSTSLGLMKRVTDSCQSKHLSVLEVAAGAGDVPETVRRSMARRGVTLDLTLLDRAYSHLPPGNHSVVGDALDLPFADGAFDVVSCSLFTHHLDTRQLARFMREGVRVCRRALLINDLVRHPVHLGLVYASFPIMRCRVSWLDGLTSVRRAYLPSEIREAISSAFGGEKLRVEISRSYLFRMGVIVWKEEGRV